MKLKNLDIIFDSKKFMKNLNDVVCDTEKLKLFKKIILSMLDMYEFIKSNMHNITEDTKEPFMKLINKYLEAINNYSEYYNNEHHNRYSNLPPVTKFQNDLELTFSKVAGWILLANHFYYYLITNLKVKTRPKDIIENFIDYMDEESLELTIMEEYNVHHMHLLSAIAFLFIDHIRGYKTHDFDKVMGECCVCYDNNFINRLPCHSTHLICNNCITHISKGNKLTCPLCKEDHNCIHRDQSDEIIENPTDVNINV